MSYSPFAQSVEGNIPFVQSVSVTVTAPSNITGPVSIGFNVVPTFFPVGTSAAAASYVTVTAARAFTGPGDQVVVTVKFTSPNSLAVMPGSQANFDYQIYTTGWGVAVSDPGLALNAALTAPPPASSGPPVIAISTPADLSSYSYTVSQVPATIPLAFQASTAVGQTISSVSASITGPGMSGSAVGLTSSGIGGVIVNSSGNLTITQSGDYTVVAAASNANGTATATTRFTVAIAGPTPTVSIASPVANSSFTYVSGGAQANIPVSVSATAPAGTTLVSWSASLTTPGGTVRDLGSPSVTSGGLGTAAVGGTIPLDLTVGGAYVLTVTARNQYGADTKSTNFTVNVVFPPAITTQPAGVAVPVGQNVTLGVVATGSPTLAYQWKKAGNVIPGATSATLSLPNVATTDAGSYTVVVSNAYGSVTSQAAVVSILVPPSVTDPASQSVVAGAPVSFSVVATGSPTLTYQWMKNGVNISGANSSTYSIPSTVVGDAGNYSVKVTNGAGSATSGVAVLIVTQIVQKVTPTIIWSRPADIVVGTALSSVQLNAVATYNNATVAGTYVYSPATGTVLPVGVNQPLQVSFTPADLSRYNPTSASNLITVTSTATVSCGTAIVNHAPRMDGQAGIDGSLQMLLGESVALNGQAWISDKFLVPGSPTVVKNGNLKIGAIQQGAGTVTPSNYSITLNGNALISKLVMRTNPVAMPVVAAPPASAGTRDVKITKSTGSSLGVVSTIRDLTIDGSNLEVSLPPGTYRDVAVSGNKTVLKIGTAGSNVATTYNLNSLKMTGNSELCVVGPVVLLVDDGVVFNGDAGNCDRAAWLTVKIANGGLTLDGKLDFYGSVVAPKGAVTINGLGVLHGSLIADSLVLNGQALVDLCGCDDDDHSSSKSSDDEEDDCDHGKGHS